MIRSMTAYGRAREIIGGREITAELKSVNSRYFDCTVRVSKIYGYLEEKVKAFVQSRGISRGKLEIYVGIDVLETVGAEIRLDAAYAGAYIAALRSLRDGFSLTDDITVMAVAQNRDVFNVKKPDEDMDRDWADVKEVLAKAVDAFNAARESEGENLKNDILQKKLKLAALAAEAARLSAGSAALYREKLEARLRQTLAELDVELDGSRILTECALFADKVAVDEELVRLSSHFAALDAALDSSEPVGRRLDFLAQEINREVNTIGSKAQDAAIAAIVIDMKCEIEKIREQIQNLE